MKRLFTINMICLLLTYAFILNNLKYLPIFVLLLAIYFLIITLKKMRYIVFLITTMFIFLFSNIIASAGGLYDLIDNFTLILLLTSINLGILAEHLFNISNLKAVIPSYIMYFVSSVVFILLFFAFSNTNVLNNFYPFGSFSVISFIFIIYAPYIILLTFIFLIRMLNYYYE